MAPPIFELLEQKGRAYSAKLAQLRAKQAEFANVVKARAMARSALRHADASGDYASQGVFGQVLLRLDARLKAHDMA